MALAEVQVRPAITRRRVLGGLAAVTLVGGAGAFAGLRLGAPAPGSRVLTAWELRVVRRIAEVWFPSGVFPVDGVQAGVAERVDAGVADMLDPLRLAGFRYVLRTLEYGTLVSRGSRFTSLGAEERLEVLAVWADASVLPRRVSIDALKAVLGIAYFGHPEVIARIGWRTGCEG